MSFRASVSVLLGCNFGSAGKLLEGAERGNARDVKEVGNCRLSVQWTLTRTSHIFVWGGLNIFESATGFLNAL